MKTIDIDRQTVVELALAKSARRIRPLVRRIVGVSRYTGDRRLMSVRTMTPSCEQ